MRVCGDFGAEAMEHGAILVLTENLNAVLEKACNNLLNLWLIVIYN